MRHAALLAAALLLSGCQGRLFNITIEESASTTVEKGTPLEEFLNVIGFGEFTAFDLKDNSELANQGVEPGDIVDVYMETFTLTAESGDADLSFIDNITFSVESEGLPALVIASQDDFPAGQASVDMNIEDVDIVDYVVADSMTITTDISAGRPSSDTKVVADFSAVVGVTTKGVVNASKRDK